MPSRGKGLFPGLAASPVPCGRIVFHGDNKPSFTTERSFSAGMSTLVQATIHGQMWWKRRKLTASGRGNSTLSRAALALALPEMGSENSTTVLHLLPTTLRSNVPAWVALGRKKSKG